MIVAMARNFGKEMRTTDNNPTEPTKNGQLVTTITKKYENDLTTAKAVKHDQ